MDDLAQVTHDSIASAAQRKQPHPTKPYLARPWLVALATVAAAIAAWDGRDTLVPLAPLDAVWPLSWLLAPLAALGLLTLVLQIRQQRGDARPPPMLDPVVLEDPPAASAPEPPEPPPDTEPATAESRESHRTLVLELDAQSRIVGCGGTAARTLAEAPGMLTGTSVLAVVPARSRAPLVEAVRAARATPGAATTVAGVRLNRAGDPEWQTPVLNLNCLARDDGTLLIRGELASQTAAAEGAAGGDDRFSRIFHSSPDAIAILRGKDGTLIDFNDGFTALLGHSREDAIGRPITHLGLAVDADQARSLLARFRKQRTLTDVETRLRDAAGNEVPVEVSLRLIELDGEICVLAIARDISKRLQAESAARSSDEKFTQVFTHTPDGVMILRAADLLVVDANPALLTGIGTTAEALVGHPLESLQPLMDPADVKAIVAELADTGRISNREIQLRSTSGRDVSALVSGTAIDLDGEPCLLCIIKDITELRHAQEQLRRSEERFRGAFENAPIGIMLLDPQGHIFQANRFATQLLNYPDGALDSVHVSRLVPADERPDLKEQLERLLRGSDTAVRGERRMLCADGLEVWTNCHIVLQLGADGEPLYGIMQIADITEMKSSQRRMERLAFYDTLTNLANRRLFNDRLHQAVEHCRRHELRAALLYLDLDQFKRVNDTLGHESGDELLQEIATRLLGCVRKEDTVGRPGGDEFTILLYDIEDAEDAGRVAAKILRELEKPVSVSGHQLVVTTSIGITVIPEDGTDATTLTKNADLAMYRAKENGRNNYQFFSKELNTNSVHRLRTEHELRRALERSEFELHFQPTIRLADHVLVGVECLLRWNHPERGTIAPDEFIQIAEETGAILDIGTWVLGEACAAGRLMEEQHGGPLTVSVNLSPRQFRDPNLVSAVRQSLRRAHLHPALLELEITEAMLMEDVQGTAEIVQRLHKLGIRLAIDDFGTGYSSLNYLKKFPIDTVKVDKTFVADIPESSDDMEITAAVIAMAHRLRMQVVAEGVETQAQLAFLTEQNCDFVQGHLFGQAMPLKQLAMNRLGSNIVRASAGS